jgi:hypothetical protein
MQVIDIASNFVHATYQINDLTKVNFDGAEIKIFVVCRIVDELREFALTHFRCPVAKYKQEGVNRVGLSGAVRSDDGRERLQGAVQLSWVMR